MVLDENRNVSPSFISIPRYLPRDSCALAARRSPWLPVTSSIRLRRGTSSASSGLTVLGNPDRTAASSDADSIRFIDRPRTQIVRSAARAASASVFSRATFDPNVVATTMPEQDLISSVRGSASVASERPSWVENTLVLSQVIALTGRSATISAIRASSQPSPTTGVWSILKSAEWKMRPAGVSITNAEDSGIECETGTNCTLNGPTSTVAGRGSTTTI